MKLVDLKAEELVDTVDDTLSEAKTQKVTETVLYSLGKALVDMVSNTPTEAVAETLNNTLLNV